MVWSVMVWYCGRVWNCRMSCSLVQSFMVTRVWMTNALPPDQGCSQVLSWPPGGPAGTWGCICCAFIMWLFSCLSEGHFIVISCFQDCTSGLLSGGAGGQHCPRHVVCSMLGRVSLPYYLALPRIHLLFSGENQFCLKEGNLASNIVHPCTLQSLELQKSRHKAWLGGVGVMQLHICLNSRCLNSRWPPFI